MTTWKFKAPDGGWCWIDMQPKGKRRGYMTPDDENEGRYQYDWSTTTFVGQHGNPFGTVYANNVTDAQSKAQAHLARIIQRKQSYEQFHE